MNTFSISNEPIRQMASGVGASWHSILRPSVGQGGSAFGGTPPAVARHERAWETLEEAACWYGLKFLRAEFEWRQFEPEKGVYTCETGEMQVLRRILGWAQRHGADVLLQQQWPGISWNAFPEFRGDPALETYSAAFDLDAFAAGWVALLEELVVKRGFTCIRWVCLINEPGWWWWHLPQTILAREGVAKAQQEYLARAAAIVRKAMDKAGFEKIKLMGPDEADLFDYPDLRAMPWFPHVQDVDFHCYRAVLDRDVGAKCPLSLDAAADIMRRYAAQAHAAGKGFYLTEYGTMANGFGFDNPGPFHPESLLRDCSLLLKTILSGADGASRWSFTNRGDVDGQWQMVETWDRQNKEWRPETEKFAPVAATLGEFMRHMPQRAFVHEIAGERMRGLDLLALSDPQDRAGMTLFLVNSGAASLDVQLQLPAAADWSSLAIRPTDHAASESGTFSNTDMVATHLPQDSLCILTNRPLSPDGPGRMGIPHLS
jgi:hypothetical protein